ncbi:MAG: TetR/AcrR family transcriptional regulator [Burkholderia sp.]|uniref:TetR/AcrR family transcriptional regulator n=1 Tax=Burkholderia sp. TaxID=36773 RepID=UPI002837DA43|nr:TetR/AcrR family transcriptional regulator [Burkholderia sp.]MDR0242920.1 TetR/AcrR family transcriptional regulator [Burkholderia sp.]
MGRKKAIDREMVLNVAENLVSEKGAASLTFDAVAQAARISKGGVQSCFGNKEALIEALLLRWTRQYENRIATLCDRQSSPENLVRAHIVATFEEDESASARTVALLAALLQSKQHLIGIKSWYKKNLSEIERVSDESRARARLAFYATEGFFLLKNFGLLEVDENYSNEVLSDIMNLIKKVSDDAKP